LKMLNYYLHKLRNVADSIDPVQIERLVEILYEAYQQKKQIFIFGNGGSGANASHFCEDIGKGTLRSLNDRRRFRVMSLVENAPYVSAWANDEGYDTIFEQQLRNLAGNGDVAIGISGSGNSKNVLRAIEYAKLNGMITVGMTGFDGGELAQEVSCSVHIPCYDMGMVESFHLVVAHLVVDCLRERIKEAVLCPESSRSSGERI